MHNGGEPQPKKTNKQETSRSKEYKPNIEVNNTTQPIPVKKD